MGFLQTNSCFFLALLIVKNISIREIAFSQENDLVLDPDFSC